VAVRALAGIPNAYLWLAGEGAQAAELRRLAAELQVEERVRFIGWRKDVSALLGRASVLIVPSREEALGLVIIEAWTEGVPVVASAAAGPAHLIRDGESGLLVPIEDAQAMAAAVRRAVGDSELAAHLVEGGQRRLGEGFTEQATVDAYMAYFERVARESGR
jgi:glycosyltransferase involved in cell wall biosynthesis